MLAQILAKAHALALATWTWLRHMARGLWARLMGLPRYVLWIIGGVIALVVALILFLGQTNWDWFRPTLSRIISSRIHRPVRIDGHLRAHLLSFTPSATVGGLKIGEPNWAPKQTLADIGGISVSTELLPLFYGHIVLPQLVVDKPTVFLFQDKEGRANWDFSDGVEKGKPTKLPLIRNFIIQDGHLTLTSLQRNMTFKGIVNAHEKAQEGGQAFALTGDGQLNGKIFELKATGGPLLNVRSSVPYPFDMTVRAGNTRITAKGRVLHPFNLGQLAGDVSVSGSDLADLYYLTGLSFPNTSAYRLSAQVTRNERLYDIKGIRGRVGASDLEGALKVDTNRNGRPYMTGDLSSRVLNFRDLGSLFGATDANAPVAPKLAANPQATRGARRLMPDAPLDVARVRGMDAKVHYRALSVNTNSVPLRQVSLGVVLDHGLLTLDPIALTFPQGQLTGTAQIDARTDNQRNTIDFRLTGLRVQDFAPKISGSSPVEGVLNARIRATGGGNTVHKAAGTANGELAVVMPGGTMRQSFAELMGIDATKGLFQLLTKDKHETEVRCAVATFAIKDGVMQAQTIVFDTGVVLVNGKGSINLKDESMKLVFKGKPKKFRLIRIQAPIIIGGHLTAPTFGVDPKTAIVQGGLAAVFQTIVPFINLDTAKNANCADLMSQARAEGASTAGGRK